MKKLLFILPLFYYSCTDDIVADIDALQTENTALESYIDSLNTAQQIADSLNNLAIQAYIDSLINVGNVSDSLLQVYIDSLNTIQNNYDIEQQAYIDSLINEGNIVDSLLQVSVDSLHTIKNNDCYGVLFGSATIDECGVCTAGTTGLEKNYLKDCASVCNGIAIELSSGICIDYNNYNFSETHNYDHSIVKKVCEYEIEFANNRNKKLEVSFPAFKFFNGSESNKVLISAPHAVASFRDIDEDNTHPFEYYIGSYGQLLNEITGASLITSLYKSVCCPVNTVLKLILFLINKFIIGDSLIISGRVP